MDRQRIRIIFFGTPDFAVPTLEALIAHPNMDVVAVVSQPDRPAGRNQKINVPPTKVVALSHNIAILQPESLVKSPEIVEALKSFGADFIVMVAFGQILKKAVLSLPALGIINLHASLLPAYRGAAPINWAIVNGDTETGITTMFTEAGVDTGPTLLKKSVPIGPDLNAQDLAKEMSIIGASLVIETLEKLMARSLVPEKQDDSKATYAPMLTKELGLIDWTRSSKCMHNLVRGLIPWPGAFTHFRGSTLKIWKTSLAIDPDVYLDIKNAPLVPGTVVVSKKNVIIKCGADGTDAVRLLEVQPINRTRTTALDWVNGARLANNERLGN